MGKTLICLAVLVLQAHPVFAQAARRPVALLFSRLPAYSTNPLSPLSFEANQAALAGVQVFTAAIYGEKRFSLDALSQYAAAVAIPTKSGNFSLQGNYFGNVLHNEAQIGVAYARLLSEQLSVGLQFNYYTLHTAGYGSAGAITVEAGVLWQLAEGFKLGLHVYNPTAAAPAGVEAEKMPVIVNVGAGYTASEKLFVGAELEKAGNEAFQVNAGLQYYFAEKVFASGGLATQTGAFYLGLGAQLAALQLTVVASLHQQLGLTPGLMLVFNSQN